MNLIPVREIDITGGTQPRERINELTVAEYAEAMSDGAIFPQVVVFHDGATMWLADGFHRYQAARRVGLSEIDADVRQGTRRDAILHAVGSNFTNGMRRTNEDKRKAVMLLLKDEEWSQWSNREIARRCCVGEATVRNYRPDLSAQKTQIDAPRKVERNGVTYEQNTANIGRKKEDAPSRVVYEEDVPVTDCDENEGETPCKKLRAGKIIYQSGLMYCHMAISQMERIHKRDIEREAAFEKMQDFLNSNRPTRHVAQSGPGSVTVAYVYANAAIAQLAKIQKWDKEGIKELKRVQAFIEEMNTRLSK